jgi:hypothetical protein
MKKWTALIAVLLALVPTAALCKEKLLVHVISVKREYLGDKPTQSDCKSEPCTIRKETLKVRVGKTRMTLTCETWMMLTTPQTWSKCFSFESGADYSGVRDGDSISFISTQTDGKCGWVSNPCKVDGVNVVYSPYAIEEETE